MVGGFSERGLSLQVNRVLHNTVLASPLQHEIDLFAAGLERNPKAGIGLAESRKALVRYSSSLGSLRPIEERVVDGIHVRNGRWLRTAGGVCAVFADSIRLFTLGSASRGIPYKEWKIPSPINNPMGYNIYPGANIIALAGFQAHMCVH